MSVSVTVGDAVRVPTSKCRSCRAPIFWATTSRGKVAPFDIEPVADGTFVVVDFTPVTVAAYDRENSVHAGKRRFQSHFASCPNSAAHRKRRGA